MEDDRLELLGGSGYQEVWDLAAPLAASGQQAAGPERTAQMGSSGIDSLEGIERPDELVPLLRVVNCSLR